MRNRFYISLALLLLPLVARAQSILDVQNAMTAATATATVLQTVTGTDGTVCTLAKIASPTIYAYGRCTTSTGKVVGTTTITAPAGTASYYAPWGFGAVQCGIPVNPTSGAVAFGSFGSAAANSIVWSCADGDGTTIVTGKASWP